MLSPYGSYFCPFFTPLQEPVIRDSTCNQRLGYLDKC